LRFTSSLPEAIRLILRRISNLCEGLQAPNPIR
jgi:hypothetical protein